MQLKLITICPIAMDTENFAAAFYSLKAVMSAHCGLFPRQNISIKSHFLLLLLSPSVQLAHIFHSVQSYQCWVERIVLQILQAVFLSPGTLFHNG